MPDPFGQLYPFATQQQGPTLSGIPNAIASLSGTQPDAITGQGGAPSKPFAPSQGQLLSTLFQSLTPQTQQNQGRTLTTTLNPVLASLSPNLLGTFGAQFSGQPSNFDALGIASGRRGGQSDTSMQLLLDQLRLAFGQPSAAERLQAASNRMPGETEQETAQRLQINPLGQISPMQIFSSLFSGGMQGTQAIRGLQALMQPNAPGLTTQAGAAGALGTAGSGLQAFGALGPLLGLDPQAAGALRLGGQVAGLGGQILNPNTLASLEAAFAGGGLTPAMIESIVSGSVPATQAPFQAGLGTAGGLASAGLGAAGTAASLAGADPRLTSSLGLASNLATTIPALSSAVAGGAGGAGAGVGAGGLSGFSAGLGAAMLPVAIGSVVQAFNQARLAHQRKMNTREAQGLLKNIQGMVPEVRQAIQRLSQGDRSGLPAIARLTAAMLDVRRFGGYIGGGAAGIQQNISGLMQTIAQRDPAAYTDLIGQVFRLYSPRGLTQQTGRPAQNIAEMFDALDILGGGGRIGLPVPQGVTTGSRGRSYLTALGPGLLPPNNLNLNAQLTQQQRLAGTAATNLGQFLTPEQRLAGTVITRPEQLLTAQQRGGR